DAAHEVMARCDIRQFVFRSRGHRFGFGTGWHAMPWQIDISPFCLQVLSRHWPKVKRYGDIREVYGHELGPVDLVCGGFPCEDISLASRTGVGIVGARSGLWSELARILDQVRPRFALVENVPALRSRGLALVLQDLRAL